MMLNALIAYSFVMALYSFVINLSKTYNYNRIKHFFVCQLFIVWFAICLIIYFIAALIIGTKRANFTGLIESTFNILFHPKKTTK